MKLLTVLLIASGISLPAVAGQIVPKWGFEKNIISYGAGTGERMIGIEYLEDVPSTHMLLKGEFGAWFTKQPDRQSSAYLSVAWGYRVHTPWGPFFEAFIGPGYVFKTDDASSSHFEFVHGINAGWMVDGYAISVGFEHISNAGFVPPNLGRDFAGGRFVIPIGGNK